MEDKHRSSSPRRWGTTESSSFSSLYLMQMSGKKKKNETMRLRCAVEQRRATFEMWMRETLWASVLLRLKLFTYLPLFVHTPVDAQKESENVSQTDAWLFPTLPGCLDLRNVFERKTESGAMTFFPTERRTTRRFFFSLDAVCRWSTCLDASLIHRITDHLLFRRLLIRLKIVLMKEQIETIFKAGIARAVIMTLKSSARCSPV